jgi:hypothetical protein
MPVARFVHSKSEQGPTGERELYTEIVPEIVNGRHRGKAAPSSAYPCSPTTPRV